jgi:hypothetical protein
LNPADTSEPTCQVDQSPSKDNFTLDVLICKANFNIMDSLDAIDSKMIAFGFEFTDVTSIFTVANRLFELPTHSDAIQSLLHEGYLKIGDLSATVSCKFVAQNEVSAYPTNCTKPRQHPPHNRDTLYRFPLGQIYSDGSYRKQPPS